MAELRKVKPADLDDLKKIVKGFAESLEKDEVKKVARTVRNRALACKQADRGAFDCRLKNYKA